jgi:uncharacterized damage-inducible protein DinB
MTNREFYIRRFRGERPKFVSVIRALPTGQLDYKPHERNTSAGDIAWFLVLELRALLDLVRTGENHWKQEPNPKSTDAIAAAYEAVAGEYLEALEAADDAAWERTGSMYFAGRLVKSSPFSDTAWDFLFDAIHHRGQLTSYIRPMGGKVPATYGPSGDSQ